MTPYKPNLNEQHVLEAKLNMFFGADVYDKYFLGFEMVEVNDDVLRAWARTGAFRSGDSNPVFRRCGLDCGNAAQSEHQTFMRSGPWDETR